MAAGKFSRTGQYPIPAGGAVVEPRHAGRANSGDAAVRADLLFGRLPDGHFPGYREPNRRPVAEKTETVRVRAGENDPKVVGARSRRSHVLVRPDRRAEPARSVRGLRAVGIECLQPGLHGRQQPAGSDFHEIRQLYFLPHGSRRRQPAGFYRRTGHVRNHRFFGMETRSLVLQIRSVRSARCWVS